jgi:hypothetical protein
LATKATACLKLSLQRHRSEAAISKRGGYESTWLAVNGGSRYHE